MVNQLLLVSSIVCSIIHIGALWYYPRVPHGYSFILIKGALISICDHGSMCYMARRFDRLTITRALAMNLSYMEQTNTLIIASPLMILAVALYLIGKHTWPHPLSNMMHTMAHILITATHLIIIASFS